MQERTSSASSGTSPAAAPRRVVEGSPRLAYTDEGRGEPVLLLHGVGSSADTWRRMLAHLPGYRIIAPDLRGHGWSAGEVDEIDDFVADQVRVLDDAAVTRAHVVGFSLGAVIAAALAIQAPERVASLVLLNSIGGRTEDERARSLERLEVIRSSAPADVAEGSRERWFTPAFRLAHPDAVDEEAAIVSANRPAPYAAAYRVLATTDLIDDVHRISAPTLLLTGEHDRGSTPRMSHLLGERIPGAEVEVLPGLQHYMHIEVADLVAARIDDFLSRHPDHAAAPAATP